MNVRPRRTRAAIVTVLGVLTIVVLVVLFLPQVLVQYQVLRLKKDPGYFREIIGSPPDSMRGKAVRAFLKSRAGKEALFGEYQTLVVEPALRVFEGELVPSPLLEEALPLVEALIWNGDEEASLAETLPPVLMGSGIPLDPALMKKAPFINANLDSLDGEQFRTPRFPGLRFEIIKAETAFVNRPRLGRRNVTPQENQYLCIVRSEDDEAVTALMELLEKTNGRTIVREYLRALGELGPAARPALPAIKTVVEDKRWDESVWTEASEAMKKISGP